MDPVALSLIVSFAVLFLLLFSGVPISWSMLLAGLIGFAGIGLLDRGFNLATFTTWSLATRESLICIPLYLLMGNLLFKTGMTSKLFDLAVNIFTRLRLKGGLAMAVVLACGVFGAVSGSIAAAISTFGPVIIPEAQRHKYNKNFLASTLAISGGLAYLIPPSLNLILFGIITEVSIADLFMASLVPGIILIVVFCAIIYLMVQIRPLLGSPPGMNQNISWQQTGKLVLDNIPIVIVIFIILGGIYLGWFTPTESSAAGVVAVLVLAIIGKNLEKDTLFTSIYGSARVFGMIFTLLIGAFTMAGFVSLSQAVAASGEYIKGLGLGAYAYLGAVFILYLILGCAIGSTGIMVLSLPILFPIAMELGIDPLMFGVFCCLSVAIAEVTPPMALNIYTMKGVANDPEVTTMGMFGLVWPFIIGISLVTLLIVLYPQTCTWLPGSMYSI
ncbi:MAG TPA: TRAP transporter large permease [Firmicutes bacterium]|jgi:C4-dicarboxylate transporter DctM subunit|nr:TRAP transporter large permease [Bacillota bacterium]